MGGILATTHDNASACRVLARRSPPDIILEQIHSTSDERRSAPTGGRRNCGRRECGARIGDLPLLANVYLHFNALSRDVQQT